VRVDVLSGASRSEGGLFGAVMGLTHALNKTEVNPRLVSHIDSHTQEDVGRWSPIPVELHTACGPLLSSMKLRRILRLSDADLLHVHGIWLDRQWAALQWQKRSGKPVVVSPHGMLDPWAVANSAWKKKMVGRLFADEALRQATCIHALCASEAESIREYGLNNPIAVIPNGIDLPDLESGEQQERKKQLLFLGRIHPKKGIDALLQGWARAATAGWELLIAGWDDGGHEEGLKAQAGQLGVSDSVSFIGPQFGGDKERLLRSVGAFILPSFSEGLPMSVLEAWSYELPVIMTDFCNLPEGFACGAAQRIEPEPDSISAGLTAFFAMEESARLGMGMRGRNLVGERFTWAHVADNMKAVYSWCLGGEKPACIRMD